jgi:YggT family protein
MIRLLVFLDSILYYYVFILIFAAVMSWLIAFDVVNYRNNIVRRVIEILTVLTEPVLSPLRRFVPNAGGLDISFLVLFIFVQLIRSVVIPNLIGLMS